MSSRVLEKYNISSILDKVTVNTLDDVFDAAVTIKQLGDECSLRVAICNDISSPEPMVDAEGRILSADIFGWVAEDERWWEERSIALESPIVRACRYESEPFWCNKHGFFGHGENPYIEEIKLDDYYLENTCFQAAILIPIHLPFAKISANSLHSFDHQKDDLAEEYELYANFFSLVLRRYISSYIAAVRKIRQIPSNLVLIKREVECLRWAAIGKTDQEIAEIIHLSHATVRYYIQQAGHKLSSVNRAQTIFKAGQLGYLGASA